MAYINIMTQHTLTADQVEAGAEDAPQWAREELSQLLMFKELPTQTEVEGRARRIAEICWDICINSGIDHFMIGGAAWLMYPLVAEFKTFGLIACFAFSERVSVEEKCEDGSVKKSSVFKHMGFVEFR